MYLRIASKAKLERKKQHNGLAALQQAIALQQLRCFFYSNF